MKSLIVFDFDHTLVDDNSDTAMLALAGKDIPQEIKRIQFNEGWTAFMQAVFTYLYDKGVKSEEISDMIKALPPVSGMLDLIESLTKQHIYDIIIISDSNSYFIQTWLEAHKIDKKILKVFTNPAQVVEGMFRIAPFHVQDSCKLSSRNLCKGQILEEFISEQKKSGVSYLNVTYVGDGVNDLCPALKLDVGDLVCPRSGYKLAELVNKIKTGKSLDNSDQSHVIKADIFVWESAVDILNYLKIQ